jgi:hypothetical protein
LTYEIENEKNLPVKYKTLYLKGTDYKSAPARVLQAEQSEVNDESVFFDVSTWSPGVYVIRIVSVSKIEEHRLVVL